MTQKRPFWVWVILLFTLFGTTMSAWSFYAIQSGTIPLDETQGDFFTSQGPFDWFLTIVGMGLVLAAAISLFMLKQVAVSLFLAGLIFSILNTLFYALTTSWLEAAGVSGVVGTIIGFSISLIIYSYARSLKNKGVLN